MQQDLKGNPPERQDPPGKDPVASSTKPSTPKPFVDPSLITNKHTVPATGNPKKPIDIGSSSDSSSSANHEEENDGKEPDLIGKDEQKVLQINEVHAGRTPGSYGIEMGTVVTARVAAKDLEALEKEDRDRM